MTESDKAVMQQALAALEGVLDDDKDVLKASISGGLYEVVDCQRSIASLRAAIAQPEQPATCFMCHGKGWHYIAHAYPPGMTAPETKINCTQCVAQPKDKP